MKIQHKRSAALDGDKAKEPTAAQTDFGEVCVNFNTQDPALFIRDNADNIVRVGGDLSLYQKIEDTPPPVFVCASDEINAQSPPAERLEGTLWWNTEEGILYVWYIDANSSQWVIAVPQASLDDVPPGTVVGETPPADAEEGQLWWNSDASENGGGRLYVYYDNHWVDTSVPGAEGSYLTQNNADLRYLRLDAENDPVTGTCEFAGGVSVTGGTWQTVSDGISQNADGSGTPTTGLTINAGGQKIITLGTTGSTRFGISPTIDGVQNFKYGAAISSTLSGTANTEANGIRVQPTTENLTTSDFKYIQVSSIGTDPTTIENVYGVYVGSGIAYGTTSSYGFYSAIEGENNYSFFANGAAPNYFAGDVGIGTSSPKQKLHVRGGDIVVGQSSGSNTNIRNYIKFGRDGAPKAAIGFINTNANGIGSIIFMNSNTSDGTAFTDADERMRINQNGNITAGGAITAQQFTATGGNIIAQAGDVRSSAGDPNSGNAAGVRLTTGGLVIASNATANNDVFRAYTQGTNTKKVYFTAGGTGLFASSLTARNLVSTGSSAYDNYFVNRTVVGPSPDPGPTSHRVFIGNMGSLAAHRAATGASTNPALTLSRCNTNAAASWRAIEMYIKGDSANGQPATGFIKCNAATTRVIDARLGATGVAMADGAADIVKLLQPKVITQGGETFNGFLPADLAGTFAAAVDGEAGATFAIGTLIDWDGTELETNVAEPDAEDLTYTEEVETEGVAQMITRTRSWSQTGTRDLMQGVSRGELIPLLTKALQEALERIEELESNTLQPLYSTFADLPNASDHHGKTAHVHDEGALYFAHAGNWVKLQNA